MDIMLGHLVLALVVISAYGGMDMPGRLFFLGGLIKGIGKIAGKVAPALSFIPGVGPVASAAAAGLGALTGGGGGQAPGQMAQAGMAAGNAYYQKQAMEQAQADAERARALQEQAMQMATSEMERAQQEYQLGAPLRDQFRQNAMSFHDPTNPFAQVPMQFQMPQGGGPMVQPGQGEQPGPWGGGMPPYVDQGQPHIPDPGQGGPLSQIFAERIAPQLDGGGWQRFMQSPVAMMQPQAQHQAPQAGGGMGERVAPSISEYASRGLSGLIGGDETQNFRNRGRLM